jgi:hypothetical protein
MNIIRNCKFNAAFKKLARCYDTEWELCLFKNELLKAVNHDKDIAIIIFGTLGEQSLNWLTEAVPVLENLSPNECMKTKKGIKSLRACLLSFPR